MLAYLIHVVIIIVRIVVVQVVVSVEVVVVVVIVVIVCFGKVEVLWVHESELSVLPVLQLFGLHGRRCRGESAWVERIARSGRHPPAAEPRLVV